MKTNIKDLTIWITGASSGIGAALSIAFAKRGATIILSGRDEAKLVAVKNRCKNSKNHFILPFDITDAKHQKTRIRQLKLKLEKLIGLLIMLASVNARLLWKPLKKLSAKLWR